MGTHMAATWAVLVAGSVLVAGLALTGQWFLVPGVCWAAWQVFGWLDDGEV